jgi:elongation factor P
MITAGDFKNGLTFEMDGKVYQVIEFQHVKPGKGAAFVRTKYRDVVTGATREASFNPTAKFENAIIERRDLEYLYNDGDLYYFMDPESYEQIPLNADCRRNYCRHFFRSADQEHYAAKSNRKGMR